MKKLLILAIAITLASCGNDDDGRTINNPTTAGLSFSLSENDFATTYSNLRSALQANSNISVVAEVNHSANASSVGENLRDTRIIFFGNPALGTPIMQSNQLAGLDLPQKILVYRDRDNNVFAGYNSTGYLTARYNVGNASTLQQVSTALATFVSDATGGVVSDNGTSTISFGDGISTLVSQNDFNTTYNNLRNAISDNPNLNIMAELDHQANAQSVGLTLNPTRVIIFGNPELGTPLMQDEQTTGLDLPQKMLVWQEDDGRVNISFNDPEYLMERHAISGEEDVIEMIQTALQSLAFEASN